MTEIGKRCNHSKLPMLLVEDNPDDAALILGALQRGGYHPRCVRIETTDELRAKLIEREWDLIISDFTLARINAMQALQLRNELAPKTPFIMVSAAIDENKAVQVMKAGAQGYVLKHSLGRLGGVVAHAFEVARLREETLRMKGALSQARKLEAVGQLASGIAHEIKTPIQFVSDNLHFLKAAFSSQQELLARYRHAIDKFSACEEYEAVSRDLTEAEEEADLAYLEENGPRAFDATLDGLSRVSVIVRSMKEFAHPSQQQMGRADLNQALLATLTIAKNEYKYVAQVETDLGDLPPVECCVGDLSQVFLNLIVNAAHAIGDVVGESGGQGRIHIVTRHEQDMVCITVTDSGSGIPDELGDKVFDPFFTTKEVGRGSGQGLAIARSIVVSKHGGELSFSSEAGRGTRFLIRLPVNGNNGNQSAMQK